MVIPPVLPAKTDNRMSCNHLRFGIIRRPMDSTTKDTNPNGPHRVSRARKLLCLTALFLISFGIRIANWHYVGDEPLRVQSGVAMNYKQLATLLYANGLSSLFDSSSTTSDVNLLGHPPGYPIFLSMVYKATQTDGAVQILQMLADSLSVVVIVLICVELFPISVCVLVGLFAAISPQFSWNSMTLLPDALASLPVLAAMFLMVRFIRDRRSTLWSIFVAGILIGISCWLRANALLLAPFLMLLFLFVRPSGARLKPALILLAGAVVVILPLTIRNALVYRAFIPVSLGAGQTLIEGLAEYDDAHSLGLPETDVQLTQDEAQAHQRPDYASSLFKPDGIARDRERVSRGFAVIRSHPFWFSAVILRRAISMLRLERTPLRLTRPATSIVYLPLLLFQKLFITAIFLPLIVAGIALLGYQRQFQKLVLLSAVPLYYLCFQSMLHTEYRYVLVIYYFLFALAALPIVALLNRMRIFNSQRLRD